jgi:uncharacterized membrane protein YfcA
VPLDPLTLALLALIVGLAYTAEAALGFGCTILALTLASPLVPLEQLVPVLVALNLVVSATILVRHWRRVDRGVLVRKILPWTGLGLPLGLALFLWVPEGLLSRAFGVLVLLLAIVELIAQRRETRPTAPSPSAARVALFGAGFFHGLFASGGPLLVWWAGRTLRDKGTFRATLTAVWLLLNLPLLIGYGWDGRLTSAVGIGFLVLLTPTIGGIVLGEKLHGRLDEKAFLKGVYALLALGGLLMVLG